MGIVGGRGVQPVASDILPGASSYFIGRDSSRWRTGVRSFARVQYADVLPGVDIAYYGTDQGQLEYDVVVAPGSDPTTVELSLDGVANVEIGRDGAATLQLHDGGEVVQPAPVAYQLSAAGDREPVQADYQWRDGALRFVVGSFDPRRPLVIDPAIAYSTYLGGNQTDEADAVAVNAAGEVFVAGLALSLDFPATTTIHNGANGQFGADVFVAKLNASASSLLYSAYFGGSNFDAARAIAINAAGEVVIAGETDSPDFPIVGGVQGTFGGGTSDAFVAKLDASGSALLFSTFLGGSSDEAAWGVALDPVGEVLVTGQTSSTNFPVFSALMPSASPGGDAFVAKLNPTGSSFIYSTYFGGNDADRTLAIATDGIGNAFVTGQTFSTNLPTSGGFQSSLHQKPGPGGTLVPTQDAFVAKLNPAGSAVSYATYLGGTGTDFGTGIAVDLQGNAFVTGITTSTDFPLKSPLRTFHGSEEAFVTKLNPSGTAPVYSTYLGGSNADEGNAIVVNIAGEAIVAGNTYSSDFPLVQPVQNAKSGGVSLPDGFVAKLDALGSVLQFSTYLGGGMLDWANAVAADGRGGIYVVGRTESTDFPTVSPLQTSNAGAADAYVAKLSTPNPMTPAPAFEGLAPVLGMLLLLSGLVAARRRIGTQLAK